MTQRSSTQKIIAGILGFAMVLTLVVGLTVAAKADAATVSFTRNLTVGSRGQDVTDLQTVLASQGFLSVSPTGYFGALTKAAVKAWQASAGLPSTGFFGPMSREAIASTGTTGTTGGTATCPAGYTCTPSTGTTTGGTTLDNTDGSLSVAQSSYVSSGQQLKKGDTKDVVAVRLQATAGKVAVTRLDVHFNLRPWLFFSQVVLHDNNGTVIATKPITSSADATEITVGSDYLVRFDNINYVVTPGTNPDLAVSVTVLPATDKITNGMVVNVGIPSTAIRTVNGKGYTDSVGGGTYTSSAAAVGISTLSGTGLSNFTLSSTGSVADIYTRISPNTAPTRTQPVSTTQTTTGVNLGTFSLKSANNASTLNTLAVVINAYESGSTLAPSANFSNIRLTDGTNSYGGSLSGNTVTFSNLSIALAQDAWKDLGIVADVAATSSTFSATTSIAATTGNPVATDANYNTATVETATPVANTVTFTTNAVSITNTSATVGSAIVQSNNTVGYNVRYTFTVNNLSNNDLFVSPTPATFVATTTSGTSGSSTLGTAISAVSPSTYAGDTATGLDIPAGGSRTFVFDGAIRGTSGQTGVNLKITQVNYGTSASTPTGQNVTAGLEALTASANF